MAKSRRNVQFPRRGSNAQEYEGSSQPGSPLKMHANGKGREEAVVEEVRDLITVCYFHGRAGPRA